MSFTETPKWWSRDLNIFHNVYKEHRRYLIWLRPALVIMCLVPSARALDPNRPVSEYIRSRWEGPQGFPGGPVYAIAQTPDGYLWIGAEKGLVRFDGSTFRLFGGQSSIDSLSGPVLDLMTDAEGNLWIRPKSQSLIRYRDGVFLDVRPDLDAARSEVTAMCLGKNGDALFRLLAGGTFVHRGGKFSKLTSPAGQQNLLIISMAQTADDKVWLGTRDAGLFYLREGRLSTFAQGLPDKKINSLLSVNERELWIGTDNGVVRWNGDTSRVQLPEPLSRLQVLAMTRDRESNVWVAAGSRLLRSNSRGVSSIEEGDGDLITTVNAIFEDREGNLWLGTTRGLERLRDTAFRRSPFPRRQFAEGDAAIYFDADGRLWFAPATGGLYWQKDGQVGEVKSDGLDHDVIYSMTGGMGHLWVGRRRGGLTHVAYTGSALRTETYSLRDALPEAAIYSLHQSRDGTVWIGTTNSGLASFREGRFSTFAASNGLPSNTVTAILESSDGTMWFGTANGLTSLAKGDWTIYSGLDGLPPGNVNCLLEDHAGSILIGTDYGIAVLRGGEIHLARGGPDSLREPVLGLAEDRNHQLWIFISNHILRVDRNSLVDGVIGEGDVREFGLSDGLPGIEGLKRQRKVVVDPAGHIWLSTSRGLSVCDPALAASRSAPALMSIEGVNADGEDMNLRGPIRLSSMNERVTFRFAGLSLAMPERIRFRYRLDGLDHDWSEAVAAREAVYTNLAPGPYRFRVIASNSEGIWNSSEASIQFEIEPVFWQTWTFRFACATSVALAAFFFYRRRMRRLTRQLNLRFEERLGERTRIAQELHDTLLQGFFSASMHLEVAAENLPAGSPAMPLVRRSLEMMRQVISEGRSALKGLRSSSSSADDLAESFAGLQQEIAPQGTVDYRVTVEGSSRPLHPLIRDEVYRIGREALVNAFRHSQANNIEVVFEYGSRQLRVLVRDNGGGIGAQVLRAGREGHWGLSGMRERAEKIGGNLKIWSGGAGAGTEVELSIPGEIAFESSSKKRRGSWRSRLLASKAGEADGGSENRKE